MNPCFGPSTRYIPAPVMKLSTVIVDRNTIILVFDWMMASVRTFASPRYRDNLNTLKMRNNLSPLMTSRLCAPGTKILRYVGKIANKSTTPKNEVEYFTECLVE